MAERKNFVGDREAAFDYLGTARQALMILKNDMRLGRLMTGMRNITLPGGVYVQVMSVYGQDNIMINVPPGTVAETVVKAQIAQARQPDDFVPIDPAAPENGFFEFKFTDSVPANDSGILTITRNPGAPARRIYIAGYRDDGNSLPITSPGYRGPSPVYFSPSGFRELDIDDAILQDQRGGQGLGLRADGLRVCGYVDVYDPTGALVGTTYGPTYVRRACIWRSPLSDSPNVTRWKSLGSGATDAQGESQAWVIENGGNVRGELQFGGGFVWDGNVTTFPTPGQTIPPTPGLTSADGHVTVLNNKYRIDSGPWVDWGDSLCYAKCVVSFQDATPGPIVTSISF